MKLAGVYAIKAFRMDEDRTETAPAETLIGLCRTLGVRVATAESCTGGLIGAALTAVPGSSDVFEGGIIAYQNRIKAALLRVSPATLETDGAVSTACARQMARGACGALGADLGIAVTGIAGPGGATPAKPIGLVCIGLCFRGTVSASVHRFAGDRAAVRAQTVHTALMEAIACLRKERE